MAKGWHRRIAKGAAALALLLGMPLAHAYPAHYFVVRETSSGALQVVSHRKVELSSSAEPLHGSPNRLESALVATLNEKATGDAVFTTRAVTSPWLRGEFHSHDHVDGHIHAAKTMEYVVRVPARENTVLRLRAEGRSANVDVDRTAKRTLEIDLDRYNAKSAQLPDGASTGALASTGDPANRLDLLVVAEGYTASQQPAFLGHAQQLIEQFLAIAPYADYRHLINVRWLFVPSNQAGADKPSCSETPGAQVIAVDTAFDATFCATGTRRLVMVDSAKVFTAAGAVPDWDKILVLVNDSEYGGSGGALSVATTHALSAGIMQHEFAHSFTLLADQYEAPFPGYPGCSDAAGSSAPCESNVTDRTDRGSLKWRNWVTADTPVPTSSAPADALAAGSWAGARYHPSGMYRACYNGIMRSLGESFCDVETEAFVQRLHGGGWGAPANGVSLIEPGATPTAATVTAAPGGTVIFQATVAGSRAAPGLTAIWRVDGTTVQTNATVHGAQQNFSYTLPDAATHTIELVVVDNTPMVLQPISRSRIWTVAAGATNLPGPPAITGAAAGNAQATLTFSPPANDGGSPITGYTATCTPGPVARSGAGSPITVTGLSNGVAYSCSVAASSANGTGAKSAAVSVTPIAGSSAPTLSSIVSRKPHGAVGSFDLALDTTQPLSGAVSVERRTAGGGHKVLFRFNAPVTAAGTASVVDANAAPIGTASAAASGNDVVVTLTDIPENRRIRVALTGVNASGTTYAVALGLLVGDIDNSRNVSDADIQAVKARLGQAVDAATFGFDLDANGTITSADILLAKGRVGVTLP